HVKRGGTHVTHIFQRLAKELQMDCKTLRNSVLLIATGTIPNARFDSQSKVHLVTPATEYKSSLPDLEQLARKIKKSGVYVAIQTAIKADEMRMLASKTDGKATKKLKRDKTGLL